MSSKQTGCMSRCRQDRQKDATYLLVLLKDFDLGAGLAFGGASPGAFGAVACPAWLDGVDPFILGPFALALGACALDTCYMHAVLHELSILCWRTVERYL